MIPAGTIIKYTEKEWGEWHNYEVTNEIVMGSQKCKAINRYSFPVVYVPNPHGEYEIIKKLTK